MPQYFQRFTALVAALALLVPLSLSAENRSRGRTDLQKLAAELEALRTQRPAATSTYAGAIVAAMNRERAAHGLGPLTLENRLSLAAQDRVDDMLRKRYFDHISPDGVNPFTWVRSRGYQYRLVGENLALGYRTSQSVVTGWMNSSGHRENILESGFDEVGIAFSESSPMRGYRAPLVVALYGRR